MFLDYYDFPKIPLNRIFCSEPIANPVEALDTFSDCAFTPSPCLRPSCRGPSSPKEFKPQHHTAIVINQDHNLYPPHDQFFQFTYSRHTAKFTGEIRQQHWWLLIGWGFNSSTAYTGYIPTCLPTCLPAWVTNWLIFLQLGRGCGGQAWVSTQEVTTIEVLESHST